MAVTHGHTGAVTLTVDRGPTRRMTVTMPIDDDRESVLDVIDRLRAVFAATDAADREEQQ